MPNGFDRSDGSVNERYGTVVMMETINEAAADNARPTRAESMPSVTFCMSRWSSARCDRSITSISSLHTRPGQWPHATLWGRGGIDGEKRA